MLVTPPGIYTDCKLVQPENKVLEIVAILSGRMMLVRLEQPLKAEEPMLVTPFGMLMLVREEQP